MKELTEKQKAVLDATLTVGADKQVAAGLGIHPSSLKARWRSILKNLGACNRPQAYFLYGQSSATTRPNRRLSNRTTTKARADLRIVRSI